MKAEISAQGRQGCVCPFSADNDAEKGKCVLPAHRYRDTSLNSLTFGGKKKLEFDPVEGFALESD